MQHAKGTLKQQYIVVTFSFQTQCTYCNACRLVTLQWNGHGFERGRARGSKRQKKKPRPQNFTIFIFETFHFSIQPTPNPVPRSKNFLYRSAPDNLITLVIFRVNGSVAMIIDFFFSLSRTLILNHLIVGPLSLKVLDSVNYDCD